MSNTILVWHPSGSEQLLGYWWSELGSYRLPSLRYKQSGFPPSWEWFTQFSGSRFSGSRYSLLT